MDEKLFPYGAGCAMPPYYAYGPNELTLKQRFKKGLPDTSLPIHSEFPRLFESKKKKKNWKRDILMYGGMVLLIVFVVVAALYAARRLEV